MPYAASAMWLSSISFFSEIVRDADKDALPIRFDALVKILNEIGSRENELDTVVGDDFKFQTFH